MTAKDNFKYICELTTTLLEIPKTALTSSSRKHSYMIPRAVACCIALNEEGIKHAVIAKVLKKNRASIYHYEKHHSANYSSRSEFGERYRTAFNKVYEAYKNIERTKKIFVDKYYMKEFLLSNGVKESEKAEVFIAIKSGEVCCVINTSYFDFSNQLENIKFALKEYKYEVKISNT